MLDWNRIKELRDEIGEDDFAEVAEIFLDELDEVMTQLLAGGSPQETSERLHFLKGCALNLGFARMAELATETHGQARGADPAELDLVSLKSAYEASRTEFAARFGGAEAA